MVGIEVLKTFPSYDVYIHVKKEDKVYTAHTAQQWCEIRSLLMNGYSLTGKQYRQI